MSHYEVSTTHGRRRYIQAALSHVEHTELLPLASPQDARMILDEIWQVMDSPAFPSASMGSQFFTYRNQLRRLSLKVAIHYNILPTALILLGVTCGDNNAHGAGGFADVFCGTYDGSKVALKRLRTYAMMSAAERENMKKSFCRESLLWKNLVHEHVVPFLGVSEDVFDGTICMVLPWMDQGNIQHYIDTEKSKGNLTGDEFLTAVDRWIYQTALGLDYLHNEGVVHGDLHAGNILVDASGAACLTDFGMSLIAEGTPNHYGSIHGGGAIRFTAPELIDPEDFGLESFRPTVASDVYSFAMTCIQLYTGHRPLPEVNDRQIQRRIVQGIRPDRPMLSHGRTMSDAMWSLTQSCWVPSATERPSSGNVCRALDGMVRSPPKCSSPSCASARAAIATKSSPATPRKAFRPLDVGVISFPLPQAKAEDDLHAPSLASSNPSSSVRQDPSQLEDMAESMASISARDTSVSSKKSIFTIPRVSIKKQVSAIQNFVMFRNLQCVDTLTADMRLTIGYIRIIVSIFQFLSRPGSGDDASPPDYKDLQIFDARVSRLKRYHEQADSVCSAYDKPNSRLWSAVCHECKQRHYDTNDKFSAWRRLRSVLKQVIEWLEETYTLYHTLPTSEWEKRAKEQLSSEVLGDLEAIVDAMH